MIAGKKQLRKADHGDLALLFRWVNDPQVRSASFNSSVISEADHKKWFNNKLASMATNIFILEVNGQPAGQIRFDESESPNTYTIDFSIDPLYRRKGLGTYLLRRGIEAHSDLHRAEREYIGGVKIDNTASQRSFIQSGFVQSAELNDRIVYRKHVVAEK